MAESLIPQSGRIVRYVSNRAPYVERPALILMGPDEFRGDTPDGGRYELRTSDSVHLLVWGVANDYREYGVPFDNSPEPKPGTWHWPVRT